MAATSKNSVVPAVAATQGIYYLATGIWPMINMRSFEAVTGPKLEHWLVKTVGAVVTAVGSTLALAWKRQSYSRELRVLGLNVAAAFLAVDCVFVARRRISRVYLLDAAVEAMFALAWAASLERPPGTDRRLSIYLNDHLAGSTATLGLCRRCYSNNRSGELGTFLIRLAKEIEQDRGSLLAVMRCLGVKPNLVKSGVAWLGEKLARLKANGQLLGYSPLSRLLELEQLVLGVHGKLALWQVLQQLSKDEHRLVSFDFDELVARAARQESELERFRIESAIAALQPSSEVPLTEFGVTSGRPRLPRQA